MKSLQMGANRSAVAVFCSSALLMLSQSAGCDKSDGTTQASPTVAAASDETPPADASATDAAPATPDTPQSQPPPQATPPAAPSCDATKHAGTASFFTGAVPGHACGLGVYDANAMIGAVSPVDFGAAAACGACVEVTNPKGSVRVQLVDRCEGCTAGDLDLSQAAYAQIAAVAMGTTKVTWRYVPCETSGPIRYYFAPASNPWWFAVQVRNSANAIASVEVLMPDETYVALARTGYNYFVIEEGLGDGPFTFRVRDVYGQEIIDNSVIMTPNIEVPGASAFPACNLQ
jgi:expansin